MINVSGHLRSVRRAVGFEDMSQPVVVNCCGYQKFNTQNYSQNRDTGRYDYQIIYIHKGKGHYLLDGKWVIKDAGSILLFRPKEPQVYSYYAEDNPEIFWIHFTGTEAEKLMERFNIENSYIGECLQLVQLFQETILELQLKKSSYEDIVISNFYKMLALISRSRLLQDSPLESDFSIDRLIMQLNQRYMDEWDIPSMAEFCGISQDYFSHIFKQHTGSSPIHFLNDLRIEKAKDFLLTNSMNVSTVSKLTGFEDPLYFSRVFKKITGVAPRQYQESTMVEHSPD